MGLSDFLLCSTYRTLSNTRLSRNLAVFHAIDFGTQRFFLRLLSRIYGIDCQGIFCDIPEIWRPTLHPFIPSAQPHKPLWCHCHLLSVFTLSIVVTPTHVLSDSHRCCTTNVCYLYHSYARIVLAFYHYTEHSVVFTFFSLGGKVVSFNHFCSTGCSLPFLYTESMSSLFSNLLVFCPRSQFRISQISGPLLKISPNVVSKYYDWQHNFQICGLNRDNSYSIR